jgi:predicted RNA-binding protein associated with RNAse of E/G family
VWYPLDRLVVADVALYYARPIAGSEHFHYHERWLLPEQAWSVSRFTFHDHFKDRVDWYIEMDFIELEGGLWRVRDGYLDVAVWEGSRYEVWDADELAEGMLAGEISVEEAAVALDSLNRLGLALKRNGHSGAALLAEFAPGLPR